MDTYSHCFGGYQGNYDNVGILICKDIEADGKYCLVLKLPTM